MKNKRVFLGMSGGVDSSVAAVLLKEQGYEVIGFTMLTGAQRNASRDAKAVADDIGIKHIEIDVSREFKEKIVRYFVDEYIAGKTPNPCVACNKYIKFGSVYDYVMANGADYIATGHYAKIGLVDDKPAILKASCLEKDQSYVLYNTKQDMIPRMLFPLGEYAKTDVRRLAGDYELVCANKPDSLEICFVPENNYPAFIKKQINKQIPIGNFVDKHGKILGRHEGILNYTIGQRKGLNISLGKRMFVVDIIPQTNTVVLGEGDDSFKKTFFVKDVNFIYGANIGEKREYDIKIRYSSKPAKGYVTAMEDNTAMVEFDLPQRAVTPGQSAVFYNGDLLIGGGIIRGI